MKNMKNMKYILGIDQGGTKTAALVCDLNGKILGVGYESGLDKKSQFDGILDVSRKVCSESGIALEDIGAVCGGLSGADWDSDYIRLTQELTRALNIADATVLNDCMIACRGGTAAANRAVVCAGTGMNIGIRRADGAQFLYGYFVSINNIIDGASALGPAAFRAVMESYHGIRGPTMLTDLILRYTGHSDAEHLLFELTTGKYKWQMKELAPFVTQANAEGDYEAVKIIDGFADENAKYVRAAIKQVGIRDCEIDLVFSGSVFKNKGTLAADRIYQRISVIPENEPDGLNGCKINKVHALYEPVCGAALTILDREHGGTLPEKIAGIFHDSAKAHGLTRDLLV
jgi:N-acetylglucosamine kinase-like BadF-type ATPase